MSNLPQVMQFSIIVYVKQVQEEIIFPQITQKT